MKAKSFNNCSDRKFYETNTKFKNMQFYARNLIG